MTDGILIAIEGIDGAGKTTQVNLLRDAFARTQEQVVCSKEPTDGPWGRKIRDSSAHGRMKVEDELHAFAMDRKEHIANVIAPALQGGKVVILDRYFYSNVAYQGSSGANPATIIDEMKSFAPIPDLVVLLDLPVDLGLQRITHGRNETPNQFERPDFLNDCRGVFRDLATTEGPFITIDARQAVDQVHHQVITALLEGPMKTKRCPKGDGCEGIGCSYRETGECRYAALHQALRATCDS